MDFQTLTLTSQLSTTANRFVSWKLRQFAIAMSHQNCIALRRYDRFNTTLLQRVIQILGIEYPITIKFADQRFSFVQHLRDGNGVMDTVGRQAFLNDFLRFGTNRQMQFAPCPAFTLTMRPHFPFAIIIHFQAGTVNDDIGFS